MNNMPMKDGKPAFIGDGKGMKKGGMAKMMKSEKASKMGKVATAKPKMGSASKRADGVAKKGKTKGKMMAGGGMAKMKSGMSKMSKLHVKNDAESVGRIGAQSRRHPLQECQYCR
jgi:hypothetical protein